MTRAEQLLKETLKRITEAKTKTFEEWNPRKSVDDYFIKNVLKPYYEELKNNVVEIRTTKKTMSEIQKLTNIEILEQQGTYYKVKVSA